MIGHATEMQSVLMDNHVTFGWGIFAAGLLACLPLASRIERWDARSANGPAPALNSGSEALSTPVVARLAGIAAVAALIGPALYYIIGMLPMRTLPPDAVSATESWQAVTAERPFAWRPALTGASVETSAAFTSGNSRVLLDRFTFYAQGHEAEMIGFGNHIAPDSALVLERPLSQVGPERRVINEAVVREGDGHLLVWYWYRVAGIETRSPARAKLLEIWAFLTRATTSELIAVSSPCAPNDCTDAARALSSFLGSA